MHRLTINDLQIQRWSRSQFQSVEDAWEDYLGVEPTKHARAHAAMMDFVATATQLPGELSEWVTATATYAPMTVITATPRWFSELSEDVQSIELKQGDTWVAILEGTALSTSKGAAPRETGRAGLGVLAGVAAAAAAAIL